MNKLKQHFLLDPDIVFLNHGSFGATPIPVFDNYQRWQRRLERQPVKFQARELNGYLSAARSALAEYFNTAPENLVFVPNATYGVNIVTRSMDFRAGDEILTSDHEYGACEKILDYVSRKSGAVVIKRPIPLPAPPPEDILDIIWGGVTSRTKLIFLSHLTSLTSLRLPVEEICDRARAIDIPTLIDGAHAPGQMDLDLAAVGADFYTGNFHKWFMAPKGAGFLFTRPEHQEMIEPLVVSWGWEAQETFNTGSPYLNNYQWLGTKDYSAYLSVPEALLFQQEHEWSVVRRHCQNLLHQALEGIQELTGFPSIYSDRRIQAIQMGTAELPHLKDPQELQRALYDRYGIEILCTEWNQRHFIRVSIQGYNTQKDVEVLLNALDSLLPEHTSG